MPSPKKKQKLKEKSELYQLKPLTGEALDEQLLKDAYTFEKITQSIERVLDSSGRAVGLLVNGASNERVALWKE